MGVPSSTPGSEPLVVTSFAGEWDPSFSAGAKRLDSVMSGGRPGSEGTSRGPW